MQQWKVNFGLKLKYFNNGLKTSFVYFSCIFVGFIILFMFMFNVSAGFIQLGLYKFSPVTSTNVGISPQNFAAFSFNSFDRLV